MLTGKVYIVGAGPGDPGLITVRGMEKLQQADVVVFDRLINNDLLSYCRKDCEKIFVGKESGYHPIEQESITDILIRKSKQGLNVVRLKGGNPFIFGRGSEEAIDINKAGINFEIIPGITSGLAAPIYSGIPITQRGVITQCVFITAHESPEKSGTQVEWKKLAKMKNTSLIIYMGASRIESITQTLIKYGMDPDTPAAAIENATLSKQRTLTSTLKIISSKFKQQNFHAPCIIVVSPTISFRDEIFWWEKKPLYNKRVVLTGSKDQTKKLCDMLYELGAEIVHFPVVKTEIKRPQIPISELFEKKNFDWVLFSSENGVKYFFELLTMENIDSRVFGGTKIGTLGSNTENALNAFGLNSDFAPEESMSVSFIKSYSAKFKIEGVNFLRIKRELHSDLVVDELNKLGGKVRSLEVYKTSHDKPDSEIITDIQTNNADVFIFTNPLAVNNFFNILGAEKAENLLNNSKTIVIGPVTADALTNKNILNVTISSKHTYDGIYETISKLF